jgi:hypothetical protein
MWMCTARCTTCTGSIRLLKVPVPTQAIDLIRRTLTLNDKPKCIDLSLG